MEFFYYLFHDLQVHLFKVVYNRETMDLSGLKSIKRIYLNNFFLSFKNMYKYFSPYSRFFDFDNVDLILLFLEYLTVPYYYLEE